MIMFYNNGRGDYQNLTEDEACRGQMKSVHETIEEHRQCRRGTEWQTLVFRRTELLRRWNTVAERDYGD